MDYDNLDFVNPEEESVVSIVSLSTRISDPTFIPNSKHAFFSSGDFLFGKEILSL